MSTFADQIPEAGRARALLLARGADAIEHPGGTLYEHLGRVAATLAAWGAGAAVQLAGLCHAFYGTDGFQPALLALSERGVLARAVGCDVEELVYFYGSCDRDAVYPQLGQAGPPEFTDRFTGGAMIPGEAELQTFVEITAANELDVVTHNPELAAKHGEVLLELFTRTRGLLSPPAWHACESTLRPLARRDTGSLA